MYITIAVTIVHGDCRQDFDGNGEWELMIANIGTMIPYLINQQWFETVPK